MMKSFIRILFVCLLFFSGQVAPRNSAESDPALEEDAQSSSHTSGQGLWIFYRNQIHFQLPTFFFLTVPFLLVYRVLAPPTFGSSPNFEAITLGNKIVEDVDSAVNATLTTRYDLLLNFCFSEWCFSLCLLYSFLTYFAACYADQCMRSPSQPSTSLNSLVRLVVLRLTSVKFCHDILFLKLINFATILMLRYRLSCMGWFPFHFFDKPNGFLFQLTSLLGELGLNIQEAHAFSTVDGFSLDVFVVDGWSQEV